MKTDKFLLLNNDPHDIHLDSGLLPDGCTLHASNLLPSNKGMKATIRLVRDDDSALLHSDNILLTSAQRRKQFINRCGLKAQEEAKRFDQALSELDGFLGRLLAERIERERKAQSAAPQITDKEREEATVFLKREDIFDQIAKDIEAVGFVGQRNVALAQYLIATSRKMGKGKTLSNVVKGPSAYGKSWLVKIIAKMMPPEEIKVISRFTKRSLDYYKGDALKHRWVVVQEREGAMDADSSIRVMQTEEGLVTSYPVKNPVTGEMETVEVTVEGPMAYTETTTKPMLNPENETRGFDLFIDGSEEQTLRIFEAQNETTKLDYLDKEREIEKVCQKHITAQRLLQPLRVIIPYSDKIGFPAHLPRVRRDRPRFFCLIETVAFVRQFQKEIKEHDGEQYIEADLRDYEIAYEIGNEILGPTLDELNKHSRELAAKIQEMVEEKPELEEGFTRRDIRRHTGFSEKYIRDYITGLEDFEIVRIIEGGRQGQTFKYVWNGGDEDVSTPRVTGLTTPEKLKELLEVPF